MINRYVIKLKPSVFKFARIGKVIINDSSDPEDESTPAGFIASVFDKTKSIEICLFNSLDLDKLKVEKKRILYYESNYNTRERYKELKKQGYIK